MTPRSGTGHVGTQPSGPGPGGAGPAGTAPPGPQVAVGAVVQRDGCLLLVERGTDPERGRWSVPGGRVRAGETLADAVVRELWEETGLAGRCGAVVGVAERMGPAFHFVIVDFAVVVAVGEATAASDASAVAWVPLHDVPRWPLVEGLAEFLVAHGVLPNGTG